jgi:hypothetical protein
MQAEELGVDGLMNKPLYFHNAFLYSPFYTFINPEVGMESFYCFHFPGFFFRL